MAFTESLNKNLHKAVDFLTRPNPNRGAERLLAQHLPAIDYAPVNEPGSQHPLIRKAWYRLLDGSNKESGYVFLCACGQSNFYAYGKYDLRRELEQDRPCCARCVSIIEKKSTQDGEPPIYEQVRNTETDAKGNVIPVGAYHNLLDLLPESGKRMNERERNMVYATLPTYRLHNASQQPRGPIQLGDWGGNLPGESADATAWDDAGSGIAGKEHARRADINQGLW
jgi:hypothetical protein